MKIFFFFFTLTRPRICFYFHRNLQWNRLGNITTILNLSNLYRLIATITWFDVKTIALLNGSCNHMCLVEVNCGHFKNAVMSPILTNGRTPTRSNDMLCYCFEVGMLETDNFLFSFSKRFLLLFFDLRPKEAVLHTSDTHSFYGAII